ncbi:(2Fe-2S)-binding protein [Sphingomonas sp. DT-207]|uniref:(2Fe-2S)-binding protein n=1 Tax=Sphingomonas sp. DT-207 TaxID=3396167 RepID=UPI003F1B913C
MNQADDDTSPHAHLHLDALTVSRRDALQGGVVLALAPLAPAPAAAQDSGQPGGAPALPVVHRLRLSTTVNAKPFEAEIDARSSLLDLLRERLGLTGTKKGCDHGQCGACTVHVDGRRVASCLTLAAKVQDREVLTIEGLSDGEQLHPMQQAFIDHDALQCGYCTPGQIMAAVALVQEGNATSKERIREYMSGNICRCGAYVGIVGAIEDAARKMRRS